MGITGTRGQSPAQPCALTSLSPPVHGSQVGATSSGAGIPSCAGDRAPYIPVDMRLMRPYTRAAPLMELKEGLGTASRSQCH
jgi:hypothetical protein